MTKIKSKRKKKSRRSIKKPKKIDVDQILLAERQLFLFDVIKQESTRNLIKNMIALDKQATAPIALYINSPGGNVDCGFAIIDSINGIESPVFTIIVGEACSMAGLISIAGRKRFMTKHSVWMAHDMAGGIHGDYTTKIKDRAKFLEREQEKLQRFLAQNTKLTAKEITKAQHGELWLAPDECLKKGIIDEVIK